MDPGRAASLAALETADALVALIEQGRLDEARALLFDGSPLDLEPPADAPWREAHEAAQRDGSSLLQLFDADGPDEDEVGLVLGVLRDDAEALRTALA